MLLPKRITPDSIIESAVEIRYLSDLPFEVLIGMFFNALDDSYHYTSRPIQSSTAAPALAQITGINFALSGQSLFYNEHISIRLVPNGIIFGCLNNQYIGWDSYKVEIEKVLLAFTSTGHIKKWIRVGIRYITEYINKDLHECTKFNFTFGLPGIKSSSTTFRSEFEYQGKKVILNLNNKMPSIRQQPGRAAEVVQTSIIDLDVIQDPLSIVDMTGLIETVSNIHYVEKELFFSLLTEEFLSTLNPIY